MRWGKELVFQLKPDAPALVQFVPGQVLRHFQPDSSRVEICEHLVQQAPAALGDGSLREPVAFALVSIPLHE